MNDERRMKLIRYLYPNEKTRQFLCDRLYDELTEVLPKYKCISSNFIGHATRKVKLQEAKDTIKKFLNSKQNYIDFLLQAYDSKNFDEIIDKIVIGYVFYLTLTKDNCRRLDIFRDKRSICYAPISIIDIL